MHAAYLHTWWTMSAWVPKKYFLHQSPERHYNTIVAAARAENMIAARIQAPFTLRSLTFSISSIRIDSLICVASNLDAVAR